MRQPFVVIRSRGAIWDDTQPLEGQRDWICRPWRIRLGSLASR